MSSILYAALFASCAVAANVTTSIWLPGAANVNETFLGSVIEKNGDTTILSLSFSNTPQTTEFNYYRSAPPRVTVEGTTKVAYNVSASDSAVPNAPEVTIEMRCTRKDGGISAVPTCIAKTIGAGGALSAVCSGLTDAPPAYCTNSDDATFTQTLTFSGESQYKSNNFELIITAGTEKLGAVAAATPVVSSAKPTGATTQGLSRRAATTAQSAVQGCPVAQQTTNAAAPLRTMVPALAGLGAAAAVFL